MEKVRPMMAVANRDSQRSGNNAMLDGMKPVALRIKEMSLGRLRIEPEGSGRNRVENLDSEDGEWGDVVERGA